MHDTERIATSVVAVLLPLCLALLALLARVLREARRRTDSALRGEIVRLEAAVLVDGLTGLGNVRAYNEHLVRLLDDAPQHVLVCLVAIDIDGMQTLNERHGHRAGDERIAEVAAAVADIVGTTGTAFRTGGDEFAVVLPDTPDWTGFRLAQRLQDRLRTRSTSDLTAVAAGVATSGPGVARTALQRRADLALLAAKRAPGQALIYGPDLEPAVRRHVRDAAAERVRAVTESLARAVDAKDAYTRSHCQTVSELATLIAAGLGLPPKQIEDVRLAGLLHDVGKIGIADSILQKPGALTDEEFEVMRTHSTLGQRIVEGAGLVEIGTWIRHHHERPDGRGYPDGLAGDAIPLPSRIILTADAFEAMTSDRPYRRGGTEEAALAELERHAGTQFDPACVAALQAAIRPSVEMADAA